MRIGEIIALTWTDVDFKDEMVHVTKSKSLGKITKPKTKSGIRDVELTQPALEALLNQKIYTCDTVFHNPFTKKPWSKADAFRRHWITILAKSGVEYQHPHVMRHTFISYMLSRGNTPEVICKIVGHANTEQIYRVYGKFIKGEKKGKILIT